LAYRLRVRCLTFPFKQAVYGKAADLNRLGEWTVENAMVIYPAKSKAVCFTRARVTEPLNCSLGNIVIPEGL
jgi:hypothetical protein